MSTHHFPDLQHMELSGLFGRHSLAIELFAEQRATGDSEERIKILFDDNGAGKTTVLRSIFHLMSHTLLEFHLTDLAQLPIERVVLHFSANQTLEFERDSDDPALCLLRATHGDEKAELVFDAGRLDPQQRRRVAVARSEVSRYQDIASTICQPPLLVADDRTIRSDELVEHPYARSKADAHERALREQRRLIDPSAELHLLLQQLGAEFRRDTWGRRPYRREAVYADVVKRIIQDDTRTASGDVLAMRRRARELRESLQLPAKYNLIEVEQLDEVIETLENIRVNSRNKKTIETVLDPYFTSLDAEADRLQPGASRIDRFVSTSNAFLTEKQIRFTLSDGLQVHSRESHGEDDLQPSQLSSGERHLLLLLGSAMLASSQRLILIDEPELSLGIGWKRKLLHALLTLTQESQARFLVASHSVEVITPYRYAATRLRSGGAYAE